MDCRLDAEDWHHDFSILGLKTRQRPGIYAPNQRCKQEHLFRYISEAIRFCKKRADGVELWQVRLETCALAKSIRRPRLNQTAGEVRILHAEWSTFRGAKP